MTRRSEATWHSICATTPGPRRDFTHSIRLSPGPSRWGNSLFASPYKSPLLRPPPPPLLLDPPPPLLLLDPPPPLLLLLAPPPPLLLPLLRGHQPLKEWHGKSKKKLAYPPGRGKSQLYSWRDSRRYLYPLFSIRVYIIYSRRVSVLYFYSCCVWIS